MGWGDRVPTAPPRRRPRFGSILWALLPLLTWGLLAPVPFVHAAIRLRTAGMWAVAAAYVIAWAVVGPAGILVQDPDLDEAVAAFCQLGLVVAATANAFVLRPRVFPPPGVGDPAVAAALAARERRERARAITTSDPGLARDLRIGRPDLPREFDDGGLVDVNHVPAPVLVDRLALSQEEAARVVEARERLGRFGSRPSWRSTPSCRTPPWRRSATGSCSSGLTRRRRLRERLGGRGPSGRMDGGRQRPPPAAPPIRGRSAMPVQLNHTIVRVRDKRESATFLAELLGVAPPTPFGPFLVVQVDNDVSLDFADDHGPVHPQHYAFLVGEDEFDQIFARIRERNLPYWADPGRRRPGEINTNDGGRGVYWEDPSGHFLEIITRPYGSG